MGCLLLDRVYKVTYKGFLQNLSTSNEIAGYDRDFAETEWRLLVRSKWNEWAKFKPEMERKAELNHALTQVCSFFSTHHYVISG